MPCVTYLNGSEGLHTLTNKTLEAMRDELRKATGRDWRIIEHRHERRRLFRKPVVSFGYELLLGVNEVEFQVMNFYRDHEWSINQVNSAELIMAYAYGFLGGANVPADTSKF